MLIFIAVVASIASLYIAFGYWKAATFKATASKQVMLDAGFSWLQNQPVATARVLAYLEFAGVIGVVLAPLAYLFGLDWAIYLAIAAAAGLSLVMLAAIILHAIRKETKYTMKMNLKLLIPSLVATVTWAYLPLI